jgi:hypothetical protein
MRFIGAEPVVFAAPTTGRDAFRTFAHLAFCASAILRREAADMTRVSLLALVRVVPPLTLPRTERAASSAVEPELVLFRGFESCLYDRQIEYIRHLS